MNMDIIERLRKEAGRGGAPDGTECCYAPWTCCEPSVLTDAAAEIERLTAENERLSLALRYFVGCAYPVATEINTRGHAWRGEDSLDFALGEAKLALNQQTTLHSEDGK